MNHKEQKRLVVLNQVARGEVTASQAAVVLGVSLRHVRRLLAAYRQEGAAARGHGNRGRRPVHALPQDVRARVVALAGSKYRGFNHQHLVEKLAEVAGLVRSRSSLRRIRHAPGLTSPRSRRAPKHRRRRERMAQEGPVVGNVSPDAKWTACPLSPAPLPPMKCRFGFWQRHFARVGDRPPEKLGRRLTHILAAGDPATLPDEIVAHLSARRHAATQQAAWTERQYRCGAGATMIAACGGMVAAGASLRATASG